MNVYLLTGPITATVVANEKAHAVRLVNDKITALRKRKRKPQEKAVRPDAFTEIPTKPGRAYIMLA